MFSLNAENWTEVCAGRPRAPAGCAAARRHRTQRRAARRVTARRVVSQRSSHARLPAAQVSRARAYTPVAEDAGHLLRFEVVPFDCATGAEAGPPTQLQLAARVVAQPQAPPRRLVPLLPDAQRMGRFTVLTYNVLADLYANVRRPGLLRPCADSRDCALISPPAD